MKVGAILVFTRQFEAMVEFYRDVAEIPVKDLDAGEGYRVGVDWLAFETGEAILELFDEEVHGGQLLEGMASIQGRVIPAIGVDDLDSWLARGGDRIALLGDVRNADWGRFVYARDVDGNVLQVYQERLT